MPFSHFLIPTYLILKLATIIRFLCILLGILYIYTQQTHTHTRYPLHTNGSVLYTMFRNLLFFLLTVVYLGDNCLSVAKEILYSFLWLLSIIL